MNSLKEVAPAFVDMAHSIAWCTAATADPQTMLLHATGEALSWRA